MSPPSALADAVRTELTAELARRHLSWADLARRLDRSPAWVTRRMHGTTPITLDDLDDICDAACVDLDLLIPAVDAARAATIGADS